MSRRVCVIGAGWSGLAAAVRATQAGHRVTLFETARRWGGRASSDSSDDMAFDNGQHILIGAYTRTLALMHDLGVRIDAVLHRMPLALCGPDGRGLRLRPGPPVMALARGVFGLQGWSWSDRISLLQAASRWARSGFTCPATASVGELCAGLTARVRRDLIEPLCVAALNTPAEAASAQVFLRVLRDALFGGPGTSDLLLPRQPLGRLLPQPAVDWLARANVSLRPGRRVLNLARQATGWRVDGETFEAVLLACAATEAARLVRPIEPAWSQCTLSLRYEPIVTISLNAPGAMLKLPMVVLAEGPQAPAQFAFDQGALGSVAGRFTFVVSGATRWLEQGLDATAQAVLRQAVHAFPDGTWPTTPVVVAARAERRATFACTPNLTRPSAWIAPGLVAAGDYIAGPYPATLEGAVRSAELAVALLERR